MHALVEELIAAGPVITDGAWGTQLQERGLEVGACPDGWNLEQPDRVEEVARAYVEAGSRIILTNTFGSNRFTLVRHDLADRVAEINRAGVEISRRAAAGRAKVFASLGPSGKMLMMGEVTADDLRSAFCDQARAMADAGADAIVVETMTDLDEAVLAVEAAKATGLPVVGCMTFEPKKQYRTIMGNTPEDAVRRLTDAGADVIGSNCGQGIESFVPLCQRLKAAASVPVWIKANAGLPEVIDDRIVYAQTPEQFASFAPALVAAGASFLGGCCGTTPEFIRSLVRVVVK